MNYRIPFLAVFLLVVGCSEDVSLSKPLLDFVPKNASAIIKINDLSTFRTSLRSNTFLKELSNTQTIKKAVQKVQFLNLLKSESKSILAFVENDTLGFESVYLTAYSPGIVQQDSLESVLVEALDFKGIALTTYRFEERIFYQTKLGTTFVMSSSPSIIEVIIENLKNNNASETLQKLYNISNGYKPATLYLDVQKGNSVLGSLINDLSRINVSNFSDWISLDFSLTPSQLSLTGISIANDSVWNYIDLFANTKPLTPITPSLAPEATDALLAYTFDNHGTFAKNQNAYLNENRPIDPLFETVEEVGIILNDKRKAVVLSTHGPEILTDYIERSKTSTIEYQGNQIIRLQHSRFIEEGFTPLISNFRSNFCSFINDVLVFSETREFLEFIIRNHKNGATYDRGGTFTRLGKSLAEESNLLLISNSTSLKKIFQTELSAEFHKELGTALQSPYDIATQISADKNFYHTNIIISKQERIGSNTGVTALFKTKLDTSIATRPQFVTNHLTKTKEVVAQDFNNVLYLISSKGKVLWKKQLEGQIQGAVEQVDIFKNGRLQLAFTTNNQFLVLDRNGKEVKRFTKTYEGGGLNPLAVFDYDGKRDYRFVITQGKKTFMYNSKGSIVKGFKYTDAEDIILEAPKHLRIGNKDHLVFKLKNGVLKILNRVGDVRVRVNEKIDFSENEVYLNKDKFTLTDKKGTLYQIDTKGGLSKTNLNLSNDHGMFATANTLVLMNDNILTIRGKKVELELGVYTKPRISYINNKIYVSVTDLQSQKVYLFDSQAKAIPNFPVFGNSIIDLADLNNDTILDMVVSDENDTILTYKLN